MENREATVVDQGFTLIELLIVMIIIAVLAAIAIPTYLDQRDNAYDSATKSDVKNAVTAVESYAVDNDGAYPSGTVSNLAQGGGPLAHFRDSASVTVSFKANGNTDYWVCGHNSRHPSLWVIYQKSTGSTDTAAASACS